MKQMKSPDQFKKEFEEVSKSRFILLNEYKTKRTNIKVKHIECGKEFEIYPESFLKSGKCLYCNKGGRKSHDEFVREVRDKLGEEYMILSKYINNRTKIKVRHECCGSEYETLPYNLTRGKRCIKCHGNTLKTNETFVEEVNKLVKDEYTVLGTYKNNKTKIKMRHNICGKEYEVIPHHFLGAKGTRCPHCNNSSKIEVLIKDFFEESNIKYETQKTFSGCKSGNGKYLPFDFCVYYDKDKFFLLEYDGGHHRDERYGKIKLEKTKINDSIKDKFCRDNSLELVRLRYNIDNIGYMEILKKILLEKGLL
ncbi:hypothetical protein NNC19_15755 [Clostridium sp. SHJSY1]|uniref:hypothetical protein n=1 Tax=Clostridium sp. SHJSY1 TaxID=2942483 RepID=UPI002875D104|nr:hypothetical protein [Clostridium sp. SHJSY1]MDS0527146.1 hypothetical protein [Clostridium sp. SHJSY1]